MATQAREFILKSRPRGLPEKDNVELTKRILPPVADGQLLVRNLWMSVDPYMRGRMNAGRSYIAPFEVGAPLEGAAVGIVEESRDARFGRGDLVSHFAGWRDFAIIEATGAVAVDDTLAPAEAYLGPLGVPGLTAYVGLVRIGELRAGDTVFVSAAAGAVGATVCQIAKLNGAHVVASAGSDEKGAWLRDVAGVDGVVNYRTEPDLTAAVARACPDGIDLYYENVGGEHLEAAIACANDFARFALCGMISRLTEDMPTSGPRNIFLAVTKRIRMQGFIVTDHLDLQTEFQSAMAQWLSAGEVQWQKTVFDGLESAPDAFIGLFNGDNMGKMLVRLSER